MTEKYRLSATVDAELVAAAQAAVAAGGADSVSAWVNEAMRRQADHDQRLAALGAFISAYEAEHGEITTEEVKEAGRRARGRAVVVRDVSIKGRRRARGSGRGVA